MTIPRIAKIISGGQTGVDRAALEAALFSDIPHGGWCPRGRRAEDGPIPNQFDLTELASANYVVRTEKNVVESDGTLILFCQKMTRGTKLTSDFARRHARPCKPVDFGKLDDVNDARVASAASEIRLWLVEENINVVNVAGPRESTLPGISRLANAVLVRTFEDVELI